MAATSTKTFSQRFIENADSTFEAKVKKCLSWTRKEWVSSGLFNTTFNSVISSLKFWNSKLEEAMGPQNVILTLYNVHKEAFVDLDDVVDAILDLGPHLAVSGFSSFENKKYLSIEMATEEMKYEVLEKLKKVGDSFVVFLNWVSEHNVLNLNIQWLPKHMPLDKIRSFLVPFVEIIDIERIDKVSRRGRVFPSGDLNIKASLRKGVLLSELPHFFTIGSLEGLLSVPGRTPACTTCRQVGHLSYVCPTPFCKVCRKLSPKGHKCGASRGTYAAALNKDLPLQQLQSFTEQWGDSNSGEEEEAFLNNLPDLRTEDPAVIKISQLSNGTGVNTHGNSEISVLQVGINHHPPFPPLPQRPKTGVLLSNVFSSSEDGSPAVNVHIEPEVANDETDLTPGQRDPDNESNGEEDMEFQQVTSKRKAFAVSSSESDSTLGFQSGDYTLKKLHTYGRGGDVVIPTQNYFDVLDKETLNSGDNSSDL